MSSPISARMSCALCAPIPGISSSRSTVLSAHSASTAHRPRWRVARIGFAPPVLERDRDRHRCPHRPAGLTRRGASMARASSGSSAMQFFDARREGVDLGAQRVDLAQQHPRQLGVMLIEATVERGDQLRALGLHPPAGQLGQPARVALPGDQGLDHVPRRQRVQRRGHRRHLDQRVLKQLLQPLPVAGAFAGQIHPQPGVVAQPPDRGRGHERRPQQALLGQLGQPDSVEFVGLGPARHILHIAGVDQLHRQPRRLQQVVPDPPVVRGGLDGDLLDAQLDQLLAQLGDGAGARGHVPHPAKPATRLAGQPHAHLARRLGHIDRGDPLDHQLVLGVGNLHRPRHHRRFPLVLASCSHFACPPIESIHYYRVDRPGASVKGTEILTGVLEATVRDPARSGPGARLTTGSTPKNTSASAGDPTPFSRLRGVRRRAQEAL